MTEQLRLVDRLALTVITDPKATIGTVEAVEGALRGGAPAVQLRWKGAPTRDLFQIASRLRDATRFSGALLIINDRLDVALAVDADGVHLGDDDLPLSAAREIAPAGFIIGRSVDDADEASAAEAGGADYVGLGPVYPTGSKSGLGSAIGPEGVAAVRRRIDIPIVAIGGIDVSNIGPVVEAGADGVAVIGAVMSAPDPEDTARNLLREIASRR